MFRELKAYELRIQGSKAEKDDLSRDLCEAQEKLKLQSKELKDALDQRKLAMSEYTEVTDKLSEIRQQKQKLSRQVHNIYFYLSIYLIQLTRCTEQCWYFSPFSFTKLIAVNWPRNKDNNVWKKNIILTQKCPDWPTLEAHILSNQLQLINPGYTLSSCTYIYVQCR